MTERHTPNQEAELLTLTRRLGGLNLSPGTNTYSLLAHRQMIGRLTSGDLSPTEYCARVLGEQFLQFNNLSMFHSEIMVRDYSVFESYYYGGRDVTEQVFISYIDSVIRPQIDRYNSIGSLGESALLFPICTVEYNQRVYRSGPFIWRGDNEIGICLFGRPFESVVDLLKAVDEGSEAAHFNFDSRFESGLDDVKNWRIHHKIVRIGGVDCAVMSVMDDRLLVQNLSSFESFPVSLDEIESFYWDETICDLYSRDAVINENGTPKRLVE
jgi:hypothetical protein